MQSKALTFIIDANNRANRAFDAVSGKLKKLRGALTAVAGIAAAGIGMSRIISDGLDAVDVIGKLSTKLGVSTEALSQYRFVAEQSGIEFNAMTKAVQQMIRGVGEFASGTGTAKDALSGLGFTVEQLQAMKPEQQFQEILKALDGIADPNRKLELAERIFGARGVGVLQIGAENLAALRQEADALGLTLTEFETNQAARANDAINRLSKSWDVFSQKLAIVAAPSIELIADLLSKGLPQAIDRSIAVLGDLILGFVVLKGKAERLITEMMTAIKTQLVDRFNAIVENAREKIAAVGEFFEELYDAVVGNSWVPDMVEEIGVWFDKLDDNMVKPAEEATEKVSKSFGKAFEEVGAAADAANDNFGATEDRAGALADTIGGEMVDVLRRVAGGYRDWKSIALDALDSILAKVLDLGRAQQGLGGGGFNIDFGGTPTVPSFMTSVLGGVFGGFFADGGRPPLGKVSVVGERGPELFVPDRAGTVVPMGAAAGGNTYFIDNRGADPEQVAKLRRDIANMNGSIEERAIGAVVQANRRDSGLLGEG